MDSVLPSPQKPFGERVARRLRDEPVIWLTTTGADGTPQPNPVWFYWDEESQSILIYSLSNAARLGHIDRNPRVSLNFDGNGKGGDIIVLTGTVRLSPEDPQLISTALTRKSIETSLLVASAPPRSLPVSIPRRFASLRADYVATKAI